LAAIFGALSLHPKIPFPAARFRYDAKQGVSAGISGHSFLGFSSLLALTRFGGDFWRPISASQNSVPGSRGHPPGLRGTHGRAIIFFVRAAIFPPGLPTGARQVERVARKRSFLLRLPHGPILYSLC
jgi:hypothetical protein